MSEQYLQIKEERKSHKYNSSLLVWNVDDQQVIQKKKMSWSATIDVVVDNMMLLLLHIERSN